MGERGAQTDRMECQVGQGRKDMQVGGGCGTGAIRASADSSFQPRPCLLHLGGLTGSSHKPVGLKSRYAFEGRVTKETRGTMQVIARVRMRLLEFSPKGTRREKGRG